MYEKHEDLDRLTSPLNGWALSLNFLCLSYNMYHRLTTTILINWAVIIPLYSQLTSHQNAIIVIWPVNWQDWPVTWHIKLSFDQSLDSYSSQITSRMTVITVVWTVKRQVPQSIDWSHDIYYCHLTSHLTGLTSHMTYIIVIWPVPWQL